MQYINFGTMPAIVNPNVLIEADTAAIVEDTKAPRYNTIST